MHIYVLISFLLTLSACAAAWIYAIRNQQQDISIRLFLIYLLITCAAAFSVRYYQLIANEEKIGTAFL